MQPITSPGRTRKNVNIALPADQGKRHGRPTASAAIKSIRCRRAERVAVPISMHCGACTVAHALWHLSCCGSLRPRGNSPPPLLQAYPPGGISIIAADWLAARPMLLLQVALAAWALEIQGGADGMEDRVYTTARQAVRCLPLSRDSQRALVQRGWSPSFPGSTAKQQAAGAAESSPILPACAALASALAAHCPGISLWDGQASIELLWYISAGSCTGHTQQQQRQLPGGAGQPVLAKCHAAGCWAQVSIRMASASQLNGQQWLHLQRLLQQAISQAAAQRSWLAAASLSTCWAQGCLSASRVQQTELDTRAELAKGWQLLQDSKARLRLARPYLPEFLQQVSNSQMADLASSLMAAALSVSAQPVHEPPAAAAAAAPPIAPIDPGVAAAAPPPAPQPEPAAASMPALSPAPHVCAAEGCSAARGLKRCGGCASVRYCSVECSRAHWPAHRAACRRLQAERAAALGDTAQP